MNKERFLTYLIPGAVAFCPEGCKLGYVILTPMEESGKYSVKLNCGHAIPDNMRSVIKKYYSRMIGSAKKHRQACLKSLDYNLKGGNYD